MSDAERAVRSFMKDWREGKVASDPALWRPDEGTFDAATVDGFAPPEVGNLVHRTGDAPPAVQRWKELGEFIEIDRSSIFVVDKGSGPGPAVFVMHGFPGCSFDWRVVVSEIAGRARVVVFDFLGAGLSDKPANWSYSITARADLVQQVAAHCGIDRCLLVGHDIGSNVTGELLMRASEGALNFDVEQAILTPGGIFKDLWRMAPGLLALLSLPNEPLKERLPLDLFRPQLRATFSREHQPSEEELDCVLWLNQHNEGDRLVPMVVRYIEERRTLEERCIGGLTRYTGPLTVLWGEQDPGSVVAMAHRLKELRPATEVITWADVGHWPHAEVPDRVTSIVVERLARARSAR